MSYWTSCCGTSGAPVIQGPQGYQGPGPTGPQGYQGYAGSQGPQGYQGYQGNQGVQVTDGTQGYQGDPGNPGASVQGPQGYQGNQGNQGTQGNQGNQGNQGVSGGSQGTTGYQGYQGDQGYQGSQGYQGAYVQGFQGPQGDQGDRGYQGYQGNQGTTVGTTGPQGDPGVGAWVYNATYVEGTFDVPQGSISSSDVIDFGSGQQCKVSVSVAQNDVVLLCGWVQLELLSLETENTTVTLEIFDDNGGISATFQYVYLTTDGDSKTQMVSQVCAAVITVGAFAVTEYLLAAALDTSPTSGSIQISKAQIVAIKTT